jgi:hypothetical protein
VRRRKIGEIQQLVDQWDVQAIGFSEVGIDVDFRKVHPNKGISSWFRANRENTGRQLHTTQWTQQLALANQEA